MNCKEIINHAISLSGGSAPNTIYAIAWINDGMELLSSRYNSANIVAISADMTFTGATANTQYPLNSDCRGVLSVVDGKNEQYAGYTIDDYGYISFAADGDYSARWIRRPVALTLADSSLTLTPEVHEVFHIPLAYYVAFMDKRSRAVEDGGAVTYEDAFINRSEEANRTLLSLKAKNVRIGVRGWR